MGLERISSTEGGARERASRGPGSLRLLAVTAGLLGAMAILAGCPPQSRPCPTPGRPVDAAAAWTDALRRDDWEAAWALSAEELRESLGKERFRAEFAAARAAWAVAEPAAVQGSEERVLVPLQGSAPLGVTFEGGRWRILALPDTRFPLDTASAALRALHHALRWQDWQLLHRLLPSEYRAELSPDTIAARSAEIWPERAALVAGLEDRLAHPLAPAEDRLEVRLDAAVVVLVRERPGRWVVEDIR